tara:strand:+ start:72 stop:230 length:159 start_codon:yes stop_codon:yes gene_type:complete
MTNKDNKIEFEINLKFKMRDYRLKLATKRAWVVSFILIILKIIFKTYSDSSP